MRLCDGNFLSEEPASLVYVRRCGCFASFPLILTLIDRCAFVGIGRPLFPGPKGISLGSGVRWESSRVYSDDDFRFLFGSWRPFCRVCERASARVLLLLLVCGRNDFPPFTGEGLVHLAVSWS